MTELRFPENIIPADEANRLEKLKSYEIIGTPPEKAFDTISSIATEVFNVPMAGITFITGEEVFFKSSIGDIKKSNLRKENLCAIAILNNDVTVIEDKSADILLNRYNDGTRFYAAAPLVSEDGYTLGTLFVSDVVPLHPDDKQLTILKSLATMVMDKLETRISIRKTLQAHDDRLHVLIHDLKNPMTTISLQSELMSRITGVDEKITLIAGKINAQSKNIINKLNHILSSAKSVRGTYKLQKEKLNIPDVFREIKDITALSAKRKSQTILIDTGAATEIYSEKGKFIEIFKQLISNAIKFSAHGTKIKVMMYHNGETITITVKDSGVGLNEADLELVFTKFALMSSYATGNENANGLGLALVKMLVDLHKGKIWAESKGKNQGTTFFVELPVR